MAQPRLCFATPVTRMQRQLVPRPARTRAGLRIRPEIRCVPDSRRFNQESECRGGAVGCWHFQHFQSCPWPEFREFFSDIWAPSTFVEISKKFGPLSAFRPPSKISRKIRVSFLRILPAAAATSKWEWVRRLARWPELPRVTSLGPSQHSRPCRLVTRGNHTERCQGGRARAAPP